MERHVEMELVVQTMSYINYELLIGWPWHWDVVTSLSIGAVGVANAKVVHNKTEHDVARVMPPKAVREWERCVPVGLEEGNELVVGDASGLWQSVHATADFDVDVSIVE